MKLTLWNRLKICFEVLTVRSGHKHVAQEKQLQTFQNGYAAGYADKTRGSPETPGSASYLRKLKSNLIEDLRVKELDDSDELCLECENLILGWIGIWFEDKIYDEGLDADS